MRKQKYLESIGGVFNHSDKKIIEFEEEIEKLEEKVEAAEEECIHDPKKFAGLAFISFNT